MALSREMEVYETESVDSDDDDGRERSSTATSEDRLFAADRDKDYERIHLDVHGAMRRFGPCWLDAEGTDFSVLRTVRRGYKAGELFGETDENGQREETLEERFARLQFEVEEFVANIDSQKRKLAANAGITRTSLTRLQQMLRAAMAAEQKPASDLVASKNVQPKVEGSAEGVENLVELDQRLARIEKVLFGGAGTKFAPASGGPPLAEAVETLKIQVEALNPQFVDDVSAKISNALKKLGELDEKRAKTASGVPTATSGGTAATGAIGGGQGQGGSAVASGAGGAAVDGTDLEKRVTFLYEMLSKLDATCDHVPAIVRRLHSLAKLHEQAQQFGTRLADLGALKAHVEKKTERQQMTLFELKKEVGARIGELMSKAQELERRAAGIDSKK